MTQEYYHFQGNQHTEADSLQIDAAFSLALCSVSQSVPLIPVPASKKHFPKSCHLHASQQEYFKSEMSW